MIAPDVNLLLYAHNRHSPFHESAASHWQLLMNGGEPIGIPVICVHGFLRLATNAAFGSGVIGMREATRIVDDWLSRPHVSILYPGPDHWTILRSLAAQSGAGSRLLTDAAIAAIALEYGATIHTNDRDFARFPGLRWHNPLQP